MYLWRRGNHFWFRKACPVDLVTILGTEIRCSLYTEQRDLARRRAWALLVALEQVFVVLRSERPLEPAKRLLGAFVEDFRQNAAGTGNSHFGASVGLHKAAAALGDPAQPPPGGHGQALVAIDDIGPLLERERPRDEANRIASDLLHLAMAIRREKSWSRPERAKALVALCQKLAIASDVTPLDSPRGLEAVRAIVREEVSRLGAGTTINQGAPFDADAFGEVIAREVRAGVAAAGRERWSAEPLSKMIDEFLVEEGKKKVGSKHRSDIPRRLAGFSSFIGANKPVREVTRGDIEKYRDVLDHLPAQYQLHFKTTDMRVAIEKNAQRKRPIKIIGKTNVDLKWIGPVCRFYEWLVLKEKIEKDPTIGVRSKQERGEAANTKRLPFKTDQISRIFAVTSAASPKTDLYWMPLLMLTTGARPNELSQLRTDDLDMHFNGRPHLNVLCLLDDDDEAAKPADKTDDEKDQRRVKTAAGQRMIPLHPILIEAGFIQFAQERHNGSPKQLFRELRPDQHGFWSRAITRRINGIIRKKLRIINPKYSAYSFRHNFVDACKEAGIREEVRMKFVGHQLGGVHGIYGNPLVLPHESELINTISFDGIDFAKYTKAEL